MRIKSSTPLTLISAAALLLLAPAACTDDGGAEADGTGETTGDGDGDAGDGDGDAGDGDGDAGDGDGDGGGVDEAAIIAEAMGYQSWVLINAMPFMSAGHDGGMATVNVWVPADIADMYKAIDPSAPMSPDFPAGSILVKEHLDAMGDPGGGTIMYKGPAGYSEASNDWWFGNGDILGGTLMASGPDLAGCIGCHSPLADSDWLFGIPAANQNP